MVEREGGFLPFSLAIELLDNTSSELDLAQGRPWWHAWEQSALKQTSPIVAFGASTPYSSNIPDEKAPSVVVVNRVHRRKMFRGVT